MNCPSCKEGVLHPTLVTSGLPALCCNQCDGYLVSMLSYRVWIESNPQLPNEPTELTELDETSNAIACPKCKKLMTKFRVSGVTENRLDSCGNCGELWIDKGEWELLLLLGVANKVSSILSQPWQSNLKQQEHEKAYEARHEKLLGGSDYSKLKEFRDWANAHKHKLEIKNYIAKLTR